MAFAALAIDGRLVTGATLKAATWGVTNLQWQALVNGTWTNVGTPGSTTYTIPSNAAGTAYRVVGTGPNGLVTSTATGNATVDTRKANAPVLASPQDISTIGTEGPGDRSIFSWLTFSDADRVSYAGGSLLLQVTSSTRYGGDGQDILSIRFQGVQAGQFSFNAATREVKYAFSNGVATTIGTLDAALNGNNNDLKVTFNGNATHAVIDALINNLQFSNNDDSPTASRLFTLRVTDAQGGSAQRVTSASIENTPDAPLFIGTAAFTVDEDQAAVGVIAAVDPDREAGAAQGISYSLVSGAGSADNALFTIDAATGALRFITAPDFEGAHSPSYSLRVRASDSNGGTVEQAVSVTVRNVDNEPVASNIQASVSEDGPSILIAGGATDPNPGDVLTYAINVVGTRGAVTLEGPAFRYDPLGRFDYLKAGTTSEDSFTYTVTDPAGHSVTRSVAVTVQGANDAPMVATSPTALLSEAGASDLGTAFANGQLLTIDPDGDSLSFSVGSNALYGLFTLTDSGNWTYMLDNGNATVQALRAFQLLEDSISVNVSDSNGAITVAQVRVSIRGSNDAPVVVGSQVSLGDIVEAGAAGPGNPVSTSSVAGSATDPEGDALSWIASTQQGQWGAFTVTSDGTVRYELDNARADVLVEGQRVSESFVATVRDSNGATASRTLTYDIRGANDNALISGSTFGYAMEDGLSTASASLSVTDPDAGQSAFVAIDGGAGSAGGTFNVGADGAWSYSLNNASATVQGLRNGETLDDTITVSSLDGTAQQVLTVRIHGADDAAAFLGTTGLAVTEDAFDANGNLSLGANIGLVDPDAGQGEVEAFTARIGTSGFGLFSMTAQGEWTWASQATSWQLEALGEGDTVTDIAGFTTLDGTFGLLSVLITGQNDAPVIVGGDMQGSVMEPGGFPPELPPPPTTATGSLLAFDKDNGDVLAWSGNAEGQYGSFSIDAAGNWTYVVDAVKSDVLVMGESALDTFTAFVTDEHGGTSGQTIQITVYGGNETPVVDPGSTITGTVHELPVPDGMLVLDWSANSGSWGDAVAVDATGRLLVLSDVDMAPGYARETLSRFNADGSLDTTYGQEGHAESQLPMITRALHVDAQGRTVAVGYSASNYSTAYVDFAVTRVLADGTLDASFGVGGVASIDIAGGYDYAFDVFLRADGKLVVTGSGPAVVRLNEDGSLDSTFGDGGKWVLPQGPNTKQITTDGQGRFLVWSTESDPETYALEVHLQRFLEDGSADTTFGTAGMAAIPLSVGSAYDTGVQVGPDGAIVLASTVSSYPMTHTHVMLTRVNEDGSWDESFGQWGYVHTSVWGGPDNLRIDGEGRILVGGQQANELGGTMDFMVARYLADGTADTSFGAGGAVVTDVSGAGFDDYVSRVILNADGTILLAGASADSSYDYDPAFVRYTSDGQLDTSFGVGIEPTVTGYIIATDPDPTSYGYGQLTFTALTEGAFGTFTMMSPGYGQWTYTLDSDRATTQALEEGQSATDTITVAIRDAMGGTTYQDVVITVIGSYDPPPT